MSSNENSSTLGSYINSATGAAQSMLGNLTGSTADKDAGAAKQQQAQQEHENSHTVGKIGNVNVSPEGAVSTDDPNRTQGSWNQTFGSAKEAVSGLFGSESLKQEGQRQNQEGKGQEAQGQLNDLTSGISDRVTGAVGGAYASLTGNASDEQKYKDQHDIGKVQQRSVEADLQKQADAGH